MTVIPAALTPRAGDRGRTSRDLTELGSSTVEAWDLFRAMAAGVDPAATGRAKGWTGLQVVVHVGAWDESRRLDDILADSVPEGDAGALTATIDHDAEVARVLSAHADASLDDALAALDRARQAMAAWFGSAAAAEEARRWTPSLLGPLPVGTLLGATAYQLAIAALDLEPCGAVVPDRLLALGLAGLVDSAGALAGRTGIDASLAALTPQLRIGTGASAGSWATAELPDGAEAGPAVVGDVRTILDVTSGRALAPAAYARGDLGVHDLAGVLRMGRVVESVPGIPGGTALRRASAVLSGVGGVLGRFRRQAR